MTNESFFRTTSSPNGEINGRRMGAVEAETQSHSAALILRPSKNGRSKPSPLHPTTGGEEVTLCSKPQPLVSWHGSRGGNLVVLVGKKMGGKRWEHDFIFLSALPWFGSQTNTARGWSDAGVLIQMLSRCQNSVWKMLPTVRWNETRGGNLAVFAWQKNGSLIASFCRPSLCRPALP